MYEYSRPVPQLSVKLLAADVFLILSVDSFADRLFVPLGIACANRFILLEHFALAAYAEGLMGEVKLG